MALWLGYFAVGELKHFFWKLKFFLSIVFLPWLERGLNAVEIKFNRLFIDFDIWKDLFYDLIVQIVNSAISKKYDYNY